MSDTSFFAFSEISHIPGYYSLNLGFVQPSEGQQPRGKGSNPAQTQSLQMLQTQFTFKSKDLRLALPLASIWHAYTYNIRILTILNFLTLICLLIFDNIKSSNYNMF
jgi:hypothetical protein